MIEDRFWPKVRLDIAGCWLWQGAIGSDGYGRIRGDDGITKRPHRVAWELAVGPIPDGLQLDHLCRVRACVRPSHLEVVTNRENTLRGTSPIADHARATECGRGHVYSDATTAYTRSGKRRCLICEREWSRMGRERRKERSSG